MKVLQFLQHHLVAPDCLRMNSLLPDLVITLVSVRGAEVSQLIQQPFAALNLKLLKNRVGRELLKVGQHVRQAWPRHDCMEVIVHNHPRMNPQLFLLTAIFERMYDDLAASGCREDREPFDNGRGDEV